VNRDQKAAVIERVANEIQESDAIFAVDYRGISVKQASDLRTALRDAEASFAIVKNTLTERAADQAGAEHLKPLLEGPTALTFVRGDVALAAKALARFRRENGLLEWKGGQMDGNALTPDELESIARLPAREQLHAQLVGVVASPLTTLVRGLGSMISGLAVALGQIQEQGLVGGDTPAEEAPAEETAATEPAAEAGDTGAESEAAADEAPAPEEDPTEAEAPADAAVPEDAGGTGGDAEAAQETPSEAPGDPVAEAEAAEETSEETPSEGEETENQEG
jgi:large subunit ribosomal protein L10